MIAFFLKGVSNIEDNTCIKFRAKTESDKDWMSIIGNGVDGCFAMPRQVC